MNRQCRSISEKKAMHEIINRVTTERERKNNYHRIVIHIAVRYDLLLNGISTEMSLMLDKEKTKHENQNILLMPFSFPY